MKKAVNPFAVCRAAKKRRIGHITTNEKQDVRTSVDDAMDECRWEFRDSRAEHVACIHGAGIVQKNLNRKGYALASKRRR